jgi:hypothetical protein
MLSIWTQGSKDKESLELALRNQVNSTIVNRFIEIINRRIAELQTSRIADYDNPNWAYKQADLIGRLSELKTIITLFNFDKGTR